MSSRVSSNFLKRLLREETNSKDSPGSICHVDWNGINGIVDLHHNQRLRSSNVNPSCNNTNKCGSPRCNNGASSSDSNKTSKRSVHSHGKIVASFACGHHIKDCVSEHGG